MSRFVVVAVSGGVDSVVLLDMLVRGELTDANYKLIVAHFDHGIRPDSAEDAEFVRGLAKKYDLEFEMKREELGPEASEDRARQRRYAFLRDVAKRHEAIIMTAHHADDLVETIAINLMRGTGWRGLAVLDSPDVTRPLLDKTKAELWEYAQTNHLQWRDDPTNQDTKYLRNDVRRRLAGLSSAEHELLISYHRRQVYLRREADNETKRIIGSSPYSRHVLIQSPEPAALELLRTVLVRETGVSPTRPQLARALHAIKVLHTGKRFELAAGVTLVFTKSNFIVEQAGKVLS